jgi:hypothetical protein
MGTLLFLVSSWLLLEALAATRRRWRPWLAYGVVTVLFCFTHHLALVSVAAQGLFAALYLGPLLLRRWRGTGAALPPPPSWELLRSPVPWVLTAVLAMGLAYALWFPKVLDQVGAYAHDSWRGPPQWQTIPEETYLALFASFANSLPIRDLPTGPVLAALGGVLLLVAWRGGWRGWYLALAGLIPVVLIVAYAFHVRTNLYYSRYLTFVQLMWLASVAVLIFRVPFWPARLALASLALVGSAYCCQVSWPVIGPSSNQGMRAAANFLVERQGVNEPVVVIDGRLYLEARYYARGHAHPLLVVPAEYREAALGAAHLTAEDLITPEDLAAMPRSGLWIISRADRAVLLEEALPGVAPGTLVEEKRWQQDYRWEGAVLVSHYRAE